MRYVSLLFLSSNRLLCFQCLCIPPCKVIQIPEFKTCLLVESRIMDLGIQNPANDWIPESKFHRQGIRNPLPRFWNPERWVQRGGMDTSFRRNYFRDRLGERALLVIGWFLPWVPQTIPEMVAQKACTHFPYSFWSGELSSSSNTRLSPPFIPTRMTPPGSSMHYTGWLFNMTHHFAPSRKSRRNHRSYV